MSTTVATRGDTKQLCQCGCGNPAPIAKKTNKLRGYIKGEPVRFCQGHWARTRPRPVCNIEGCERPHEGRGYCEMHYTRWKRHGTPTAPGQHGMSRTPTYQSWVSMIQRCTNPNAGGGKDWSLYGGRGISIDPRWRGKGGFENFLADMGERPEGTSIDRIDPDGSYFRENCRWTDAKTQRANQRPRKATALAGEVR